MRNALSMLVPPIVVDPTSFRLHTRAARGLPEAYLRGIFARSSDMTASLRAELR